MDSTICKISAKEEAKSKLINFMKKNGIEYNLIECCGCERFSVSALTAKKSLAVIRVLLYIRVTKTF